MMSVVARLVLLAWFAVGFAVANAIMAAPWVAGALVLATIVDGYVDLDQWMLYTASAVVGMAMFVWFGSALSIKVEIEIE